jgi:hypothetical protein
MGKRITPLEYVYLGRNKGRSNSGGWCQCPMTFSLVLHRSDTLTSPAIMKNQLARLPPNILSHHREGHIGWQHRLIAQKLPHIFRPWAGLMADDLLLFSGGAVGCVVAVKGRLGPVLVLCFYGHGGAGRAAWGSGRITRVER